MNMKKIKKAAIIGMCCTMISTSTVFAVSDNLKVKSDIKIQINNEWVQVDLNPFIENDRTLVYLNEFMEKLGAKVESDLNEGKIKIYTEDVTIELTVGKNSAKIIKNDGGLLKEETINIEISPKIIDEKAYVPLRFAAETFGFDVKWDNFLREVIIREEGDIISVEKNEVTKFVQNFGEQLKMVSLLAPEDILKETMNEYYGDYVSAELIEKWLADPVTAPGKLTSSPWPERIDVLSVEKSTENEYIIKGNIIELTSAEVEEGGIAAKREITLDVKNINNKFMINDVTFGEYEVIEKPIVYKNEEYGFNFELPEGWKNYSLQDEIWKGTSLTEDNKEITGPIVYIRHPEWTKDNPRQDIPIMIFTVEQWKELQNGEFSVGAAPIAPRLLGENSKYVFALPARYNYAFLTGFEEVEKILENNPLQAFEIK